MNDWNPNQDPTALANELDEALKLAWGGRVAALEQLLSSFPGDGDDDAANQSESASPSAAPLAKTLHELSNRIGRVVSDSRLPDIPGFELVGEIGRGGMGVVYEAVQSHPQRRVAIKVIQPNRATDHRHRLMFDREIRALASLDHPHIARLHSAGATADDRAFFVMELVRGASLVDFAQAQALERKERLSLFLQLCDAVHHAHMRGVIHRDLKPANILVSDGSGLGSSNDLPGETSSHSSIFGPSIKILDFGLARLTEDLDNTDLSLALDPVRIKGTVAYMSPEQRQGRNEDVDVRSDVFALGVILYQLLTERLPVDVAKMTVAQAVRALDEREAPPMSRIDRNLRGDLDVIAATAMASEPELRYQSAAQLAEDVRRHLRHEPIAARAATAAYQLRKFARRNRTLVVGAALIIVALTIGLAGTLIALQHAAAAQRTAVQARSDADKINEFLTQMLASANPEVLRGRNFSLEEMLHHAVQSLDQGLLRDQPAAESRIRQTLAMTYQSLGLYPSAQTQFERALDAARIAADLADVDVPAAPILVADIAQGLAEIHLQEEHWNLAQQLSDEALQIRQRQAPNDRAAIRSVQRVRARVLEVLNRREDGRLLREQILQEAIAESDDQDTLEIAQLKLDLARAGGAPEQSARYLRLYEESLATFRNLVPGDDFRTALVLSLLAGARASQGQHDEADAMFNESLAMRVRLYGDDHPSIAGILYNWGYTRYEQGRYEEALDMFQRSLTIREARLSPGHYWTGRSQYRVGQVLLRLGRHAEAESHYRAALDIWRRHLPVLPARGLHMLGGLSACLIHRGAHADAEPLLLEYHDLVLEVEPGESFKRIAIKQLIELYEGWGQSHQAEHWRAQLATLESEAKTGTSQK